MRGIRWIKPVKIYVDEKTGEEVFMLERMRKSGKYKDFFFDYQGHEIMPSYAKPIYVPIEGDPIPNNPNLPSDYNSTDELGLGTVYNQLDCASCYGYAASTVASGVYKKKTGINFNFSPSPIVYCGSQGWNGTSGIDGCNGMDGLLDNWALKFLCYYGDPSRDQVTWEADNCNYSCYPAFYYNASTGVNPRIYFTNYGKLEANTDQELAWLMQDYLYYNGPLYAVVKVDDGFFNSPWNWTDFFPNVGGRPLIYNDIPCEDLVKNSTHAVTIVGWGFDSGAAKEGERGEVSAGLGLYWIVKDSRGIEPPLFNDGYRNVKASSCRILCNVYYLSYERGVNRVWPCDTYEPVCSPGSASYSWTVAHPERYSNSFPGIGYYATLNLLPGQSGGSDVLTYTVTHAAELFMNNTNAIVTETFSGPIDIQPLPIPVVNGPTNIPVSTNKFYYATFTYSFPSELTWSTSGPLEIVSGQGTSSCYIRATSCGQGVLSFTIGTGCSDPKTGHKTIYIDCPAPLVYPNPASNTLTVIMNEDFEGDPEFEHTIIDNKALSQKSIMTKNKEIVFDVSDLMEGLYILRTRLLRPDEEPIESNLQFIVKR